MDTFYALAEPKRRSIIEMLAIHGQLSATSIAQNFDVSTAAISQHLKILREARLVRVEKRAQQRIYQLNPAAMIEIEAWVRQITREWDGRFRALDRVLAAEKRKLKEEDNGN